MLSDFRVFSFSCSGGFVDQFFESGKDQPLNPHQNENQNTRKPCPSRANPKLWLGLSQFLGSLTHLFANNDDVVEILPGFTRQLHIKATGV